VKTINGARLDRFIEKVYGMAFSQSTDSRGNDVLRGAYVGPHMPNWVVTIMQHPQTGITTVTASHQFHKGHTYVAR
jgi:hypothetical protein